MASSLIRFPDLLKDRAVEYAERIGISFNALVVISLNNCLDQQVLIPKETSQSPIKPSTSIDQLPTLPQVHPEKETPLVGAVNTSKPLSHPQQSFKKKKKRR